MQNLKRHSIKLFVDEINSPDGKKFKPYFPEIDKKLGQVDTFEEALLKLFPEVIKSVNEGNAFNFYPNLRDSELENALTNINLIDDPLDEWRVVTANKDHVDEFGDLIIRREDYYKKTSNRQSMKLSVRSFETFYITLFFWNRFLRELTNTMKESPSFKDRIIRMIIEERNEIRSRNRP